MPCAVVVHSEAYGSVTGRGDSRLRRGAAGPGEGGGCRILPSQVHRALARLLGMQQEDVAALALHSRSIDWRVAQMVTPMEALVANPPTDPPWVHLESAGPGAALIITGDFMTQSSFLGCVAAARAASEAVCVSLSRQADGKAALTAEVLPAGGAA